jgi:hypothetical protein
MPKAGRSDAAALGALADTEQSTSFRVERPCALTASELAWVVLLPCALIGLAAVLALGPPLGHALLGRSSDALWPPTWWAAQGRTEPVEHGRFLIALLAPVGLTAAVLVGARHPPRLRPTTTRVIVATSQASLLGFVVVALLGQRGLLFDERPLWPVFDDTMLVVASVLVLVLLLTMRAPPIAAAVRWIARERRLTRIGCSAAAVAISAIWLLEAIETDRLGEEIGLMNWTLNDAFAVLNGHDPLVDYHLLYAKLLPYPAALALSTIGQTGFVYSLFMTALSLLALIAVYAIFCRVTGSSLSALALFVPFVALGDMRHTMLMPAMWPMRYGGAYLLAWLTIRHLDGRRPQRMWLLFLVAGIVTINDLEFGLAALTASAVALVYARPPRSARDLLPLAAAVGAGVAAAIASVCVLTLARAGTLPKPGLLLEWPRIFTDVGWYSLPIPSVGLHLAIYATLCGAITVATVRLARGAGDVLLTSMLVWSGVFGLLAAGYYAGRSDDAKLAAMFSAWAFAIALLTVVCVRALSARRWRAPSVAELLVLLGFGLSICAVSQLVSPFTLIRRLTTPLPAPQYRPVVEQLIAQRVSPGEKVVILVPESFRIAYELGVDNVAPYPLQIAIVTRSEMQTLIDVIERERVDEVFVPTPGARLLGEGDTALEQVQRILAAGFTLGVQANGILELRRVSANG